MEILDNNYNNELIILASRPGRGKTYRMLQLIKEAIVKVDKVLFISLDSPESSINGRLNINSNNKLIIYDKKIDEVNEIEKLIKSSNANIVFIDYIQLIPDYKQKSVQEVLKDYTVKYNIPIIANEELSRQFEYFDIHNKTILTALSNLDSFVVSDKFIIV